MEILEVDGQDMSTIDAFDISVLGEFDNAQNELLMVNADGADKSDCQVNSGVRDNEIELLSSKIESTLSDTVDDFKRASGILLDVSIVNGESDLVDGTIIDEHVMENNSFGNNLIGKGMVFGCKELVVHACQRYSLLNRVEYQTYKSDKDRLILICRAAKEKCAWHVRAVKRKKGAMWEITRYDGLHTCETNIVPKDNVHLNKDFIAMEIKDLFQENFKLSPKAIKQIMSEKFGYEIPYLKAWKAREKALKFIYGDCKESFIQPCNGQPCDDQRCNKQPCEDWQFSEQPCNEQQQCDELRCNDKEQCSEQPCNEQSVADEHEHSSYVKSLVRSGQTAAEIFLNDPIPRTRKLAFDLFHASLAELVELGKESALNIDPTVIQLSRELSCPNEGEMPAKYPANNFSHDPQPIEVDGQVDSSCKKSKGPKRKHDQISL